MNNNDLEFVKKMIDVQVSQALEMILLGETILNSGGDTQTWQIKTARGEIIENAKHLEQYGITTSAPSGSETLGLRVRGNRTNTILLNIGNRKLRFKILKSGEVCIYDDSGNTIHLQNGGNIEVKAPSSVTIKTKTAKVEATTVAVKATNITLDGETDLGGVGGLGAARLSDEVEVVIDKGSSAGTYKGKITTASLKVRAL